MAAFRRAAEMGAEAVELDVRRTLDGVLVVHHNPHLHDGQQVSAITFAAMRASTEGAAVPTLSEALDACAGMWVNVEIKNDPTSTLPTRSPTTRSPTSWPAAPMTRG